MKINHVQSKSVRPVRYGLAAAALLTSVAVLAGAVSDTRGGTISSGTHKVEKDAFSTDSHDPRAETYYSESLNDKSSTDQGKFSADFNVVSAHRTTIAQVLHCNNDLTDKCRPVVFLVGYKSNGKVKLCSKDCGPDSAGFTTTPDSSFKVEISASRSQATVKITDGRYSESETITYPSDRANNGTYQLRYGAYHHHTGRYDWSKSNAPARPREDWPNPPKAFSKAEVTVSNASWTRS
jgi:hypothetical protein